MQLTQDEKRYSLRALCKATGIGYKVLANWVLKGWLLPSCRLPKTFRYTMEDFKKAEAKSFEGKSKFPKTAYTDKKTGTIDFNKAIGV